jgi:hypothetical protein
MVFDTQSRFYVLKLRTYDVEYIIKNYITLWEYCAATIRNVEMTAIVHEF